MKPSAKRQLDTHPRVAVIVCTYNGAAHIEAQLDSLLAQNWPVAIHVFDDASTDDTRQKVERKLRASHDHLTLRSRNIGYVANFEKAIANVVQLGFDYLALCDQDDIWQPERIALGMTAILSEPSHICNDEESFDMEARLVHSDLSMIDAAGQLLHPSFLRYRGYATTARRCLPVTVGQNGVMGNTILMNAALARLVLPFPEQLPVHDYWIGLIAELFGHRQMLVEKTVNYRIHNTNASNSQTSIRFGKARILDNMSWQKLLHRDFKLPFLEDARLQAIDGLLDGSDARRIPNNAQARQLKVFRSYLRQDRGRLLLIVSMISGGFIRPGLSHRLRFVAAQLFTQRYRSHPR